MDLQDRTLEHVLPTSMNLAIVLGWTTFHRSREPSAIRLRHDYVPLFFAQIRGGVVGRQVSPQTLVVSCK